MKLSTLSVITVSNAVRDDLAPVVVLDEADEKGKEGKEGKIVKKVKEDPAIARAYDQTGKSQEDIAAEIGVHASTVSRWKSENPKVKRNPLHGNLGELVKTLGQQPFRELKP
jgi:ribosome-binding protein aMBF1 (putative translation factor)